MNARTLACALLLSASAFAAPKSISLKFDGTLHDALHKIADAGDMNIVLTNDFKQHADVNLKSVSAEEALQTVASAYHLSLEHHGAVWTVAPEPENKGFSFKMDHGQFTMTPPMPPTPPTPPGVEAKAVDDAMKQMNDEMAQQSDKEQEDKDGDKEESDDDSDDNHAPPDVPGHVHPHIHINMGHHKHDDHDFVSTGPGEVAADQSVGDAVAFGGGLTVDGNVEGDAAAMGGDLNVHGHVDGDASAMGGSVHVFPGGSVGGDAVAFGGSVIKDDGAEIGGSVQNFGGGIPGVNIKRHVAAVDKLDKERSGVLSFFVWFIVLFSAGFLSTIFAPSRMKQIELELKSEPIRCGITGLLGSFALLALTVFLCITLIGIPFAAALLLAVSIGVVMGISALASEIGMRLPFFRGRKTQALVLAVGLLALLLVWQIPVMGVLSWIAISLIALGAVIRTRFGGGRRQGIPEPLSTPVGA